MKKLISLLLAAILLLSCVPVAFAADNSRKFLFELSVDGKDTVEVEPGELITVTLYLHRTASDEKEIPVHGCGRSGHDLWEFFDTETMRGRIRHSEGFPVRGDFHSPRSGGSGQGYRGRPGTADLL